MPGLWGPGVEIFSQRPGEALSTTRSGLARIEPGIRRHLLHAGAEGIFRKRGAQIDEHRLFSAQAFARLFQLRELRVKVVEPAPVVFDHGRWSALDKRIVCNFVSTVRASCSILAILCSSARVRALGPRRL